MSASVLLPALRAFSFCGAEGFQKETNSIESIQRDSEEKWSLLPLDHKIPKTFKLGAVLFKSKILVFGGTGYTAGYTTLMLSEEGELEEDFSDDPLNPGSVRKGVFTVKRGRVLTLGFRNLNDEWRWRAESFDGKHWALL